MLVRVATPSGDEAVSLTIRGGGGVNNPGKIVAVLLAAVEAVTGVPIDDYADQLHRAARDKGNE